MTKLLSHTGFYAGKLVNHTELGNKLELDRLTIKKYLALLERLFLVEVDLTIENGIGDCFAVEVNAAATLNSKDFTGLKRFQNTAGKRFELGILLYDCDHTTAFGDQLFAVPFGALWS